MSVVLVSLAAGASAGLVSSLLARRIRGVAPERGVDPQPQATTAPVELPLAAQDSLAAILPPLSRALSQLADELGHPGELTDMPEFQAVLAALRRPDATFSVLSHHALGGNWSLACAAFAVLAEHSERQSLGERVLQQLEKGRPFTLPYALRFLASLEQRPPIGAALLGALPWWQGNPVIPGFFVEYFDCRAALGDRPDFGDLLARRSGLDPAPIDAVLRKIQHPFAGRLLAGLRDWAATRIDRSYLSTVGMLWDPTERDRLLIAPDIWADLLETAATAIRQQRPRSVLVTGDPGVGKTAFIELLAGSLQQAGWTVFSASGAELMADQTYIGQLEGRIRKLVEALHARRKLVWHVGDLGQLTESGRHQGQTASILDQILPAMASGELIVIGESSPAAAARLAQGASPEVEGDADETVSLTSILLRQTGSVAERATLAASWRDISDSVDRDRRAALPRTPRSDGARCRAWVAHWAPERGAGR